MMNEIIGTTRVLVAEVGAWLTDGNTFSQKVYLGKDANASDWHDASTEEYEAWKSTQGLEDEEATAEDYEAALPYGV